MILRPYQEEAVKNTIDAFQQHDAVLAVMATGLGKTVFFSHIAKDFMSRGRVMVLAHREELISQAKDKLLRVTGIDADIEMGDSWAMNNYFKSEIVVSTIQTQVAGMDGEGRMTRFEPHEFSSLIVDEAHHAVAPTYQRVIKYFRQNPSLKVLGVTATPDRADELALGKIFSTVSYEYDIRDGIDDGWLVLIEQNLVEVHSLDFSQMRTTAGDLNGKDLAEQMEHEENLHGIADPTIQIVGDRKTLVFAASVDQAERLAEIFNRHRSGSAEFVTGKTPKEYRRKIFDAFAKRELQYLVNVGVATEGFDDPSIEVVVMARPTKSRCLYTQMAGRGTRPLEGLVDGLSDAAARKSAIADSAKPSLEIIDFVGNCGRHKLVTSADILGGRYEDDVIDLAKQTAREESQRTGKPVDMMTELQKAESEIARRRRMREEAEQRKHIIAQAQFKTTRVDPFNVFDITPYREPAWHKGRPATEKQLNVLERNGVSTDGVTFIQASQIIDTLVKRREANLCSYKQAKLLRRHGIDPTEVTFEHAKQIINLLAANGWRKVAI
ncbi:MAG: DEAD/DEAH box helicase [Sedimentisphaerales bacterium]|nr:DEAD/DEAH box helicase [Sedimentisphaerales bacterium]